ncbi:uncharacterized protein [Blastocystis hominis]|uniref:UNC93-like protein MFSD11 n=1 Tax=Blastocystis hominis TaxID=12968 RepID=D8MB80_BLAHO|nr:uncharacterized protein [Blastocystis hominis]CBK25319.2 unnamed protein product [Blastocystis hominis]|eukprot:XP_012899367.1 uncharacterized protein [Blastocystis hominis]
MRRQSSRKMSICEPVINKSEVQGGTKMNAINVALLSVAFGINFFGTNAFMNFAVPILGNIGSIGMAIVNIVNAFSNFLVPSVIKMFGSAERTIFWCGFSYIIYISQFSYILPVVPYLICACHGFLSAMVWASQGIILGNNSNDSDRGKKSGIFMSIYMFGSVFPPYLFSLTPRRWVALPPAFSSICWAFPRTSTTVGTAARPSSSSSLAAWRVSP